MGRIEERTPADFAHRFLWIEPHDGQVEWLNCRATTKIACCGRRWGKTFSTSADLLWFAATKPETTQFLIAPTYDQVTILFRYVERLVRERFPAPSVAKVVQSPFPEITLANGSSIKARSAGNDAANLRGHGADRIVIDEAAFVPPEVYETVAPLLATSPYGELVLISTPFGMNTFYQYWQRGQGGDPAIQSFRFPSATNPYLSQQYLEQQRRDMTAAAYAQEYEATFREDQNAVFPYSLIQSCLSGDPDPDPEPHHRYVLGYDPAKYQDRSGVVVLDVTESPWQIVRVLDIAGRDYLTQAGQIETLCTQYNNASVLLDATSHDQMLEHLLSRSVQASGFKFTNESKQELINGLVLAMERHEVAIPRHPALIEELTHYRYELTAAGNVKLGADERHHDDLVTALALAVQKVRGAVAFRHQDIAAAVDPALTPDQELFA